MTRATRISALAALLFFTASGTTFAKGPTVKLTVSGPGIEAPLEFTGREATDAGVWGGAFFEEAAGAISAPASDLRRYTVQFHVLLRNDVRVMYVVYYVWDAASGQALVQLPGPQDPWYRLNTSTIWRGGEGNWYRASKAWGDAIRAGLPAEA